MVHRRVVAVVPYNDRSLSEAFYNLLGFHRNKDAQDFGDYVMLSDIGGAEIHLSKAPEGWLDPAKNAFAIYLYADNVEEIATRLGDKLLQAPKQQPWGMFECAASDPDNNLVRVGRPLRA